MRAPAVRFGILVSVLVTVGLASAYWQGLDEGFRVQFSSTDSIRLQWSGANVNTPYVRYLQTETPSVDRQYAACYVAVPRGKVPTLIGHTGFNDTTVVLADPICMRDLWMAPINLRLTNPTTAAGSVTSGTFTIAFTTSTSAPPALTRGVSTVFTPLYKAITPNFADVTPTAGTLLQPSVLAILGDTAFRAPFANWVNWKKSLGWKVTVTDSAHIGGFSPLLIKGYIQTAYDTWSAPPDAVILVGNHAKLPDQYIYTDDPGTMWSAGSENQPYPGNYVDENYYSRLDGLVWHTLPDPMPDMLIGRMSVGNVQQVNDQVIKTVNYEARTDTFSWSNRAVIAADTQSQTNLFTKRWTRSRMMESGIAPIDSLFGQSAGQYLNGLLAQGRCIVNYRGQGWNTWWYGINYFYTDVQALNNPNKPVIVTGIGCGVAKFDESICFGEVWMQRGQNLGAVGFLGPTWNTHTQYNNQIDIGLYRFWFHNQYSGLMLGLMGGKAQLMSSFSGYSASDPNIREILRVGCSQYIALSDPTLNIIGGVLKPITVQAPTVVGFGQQSFAFTVTNSADASPHGHLMVAVYDTSGPLGSGWTDSTGTAIVNANVGFTPRYIHYAVSGFQSRVKIDSIAVVNLYQLTFDSISYPGSGSIVSPGDTIHMTLAMTNPSAQTLTNVVVRLDSLDSNFTVLYGSDTVSFSANQSRVLPGYTVVLSPSYRSAQPLRVHFVATSGSVIVGMHGYTIPAGVPVAAIDSVGFDASGNHWLDRGETAPFSFTIHNNSLVDLPALSVRLLVNDSLIRFPVTQTTVSVAPYSQYRVTTAFTAISSDSLPTYYPFHIAIVLQKTFPNYTFIDTMQFVLETGTVDSTAPSHVAGIPYYAYESSDQNYSQAPAPAYMNISPVAGGNGFRVPFNGGNDVYALSLNGIVAFRYFGHQYPTLTICTDGWVAPGDSIANNPLNDTLPSVSSPRGVIAPYWDNLFYPGLVWQNVLYYRDVPRHRLIIQWDSVALATNSAVRLNFQVILYDATFDTTPNGDSKIEFVYSNIPQGGTPTIGIESPDNSAGMTLVYNSVVAPTIHANHTFPWTVRFTSRQPSFHETSVSGPNGLGLIPSVFSLKGPYPNPFNPETRISVAIPSTMLLKVNLYNVQGELVRKVISTTAAPGHYDITIRGNNLPSGVYFLQVIAGSNRIMRKMSLIR